MQADYTIAVTQNAFDLVEINGALIALLETKANTDHLYIVNVAVNPATQRQGFASKLLERAEVKAAALGLNELRLITNALYAENLRFYEKRGYEITSRGPLLGGEAVHMRKFI